MQQLAYAVADNHGRVFRHEDRHDILTRAARAVWSFKRLEMAAQWYVVRTAFLTLLDGTTAAGSVGKGTEALGTITSEFSPSLLTNPEKGTTGLLALTPKHFQHASHVLVGLTIARTLVRTVYHDDKGRANLGTAYIRFKQDGLAALGFYKITTSMGHEPSEFPNGTFMGMPVGSAHRKIRVVTPFALGQPH